MSSGGYTQIGAQISDEDSRLLARIVVTWPRLNDSLKLATGGRRTVLDYATCLDYLANNSLPEAAKIILVMDNLNTHKQASLYQAFPPEKAQMLCERFESISGPSWGGGRGEWIDK